ncbi:MAG: hypothetical protein R6V53_06950 [Candidatus Woesearchaeota archaeon]
MFELMKARLSTILLTNRRKARRERRAIKDQEKEIKKLEEEKKQLEQDIETGDVEAVKKDFENFLEEYKKAIEDSFQIESTNLLFATSEGEEIKEQEENMEKIKRVILKLPDDIYPIKYKGKSIKNKEELQKELGSKFQSCVKKLKEIHDAEKQTIGTITKQILDQSRDMQHLRDEIYSNLAQYNTEQATQWLRRNIKGLLKDMDRVLKEEKSIEKMHLVDGKSVKKLLEEMDALEKEESQEQKDLYRAFQMESLINLWGIYEYFELINKYGHEYVEKTLLPKLKQEGYPETDPLLNELRRVTDELKKEGTEIRNIALQAQQRT